MCGGTEILPSVAMFCSGLKTHEREIYSGRYTVWFLSAKQKSQRTGDRPGGITFLKKLQHILHLPTKNRFSFTWVIKYSVINVTLHSPSKASTNPVSTL